MALLLLVGGPRLSSLLGLSAGFLQGVGLVLVPWVLLLCWALTRPALAKGAVVGIVAANLAWVTASATIVLGGVVSPTPLGTAFIAAQAVAVAFFAELQWSSLRPARAAA
jgi:hypothetical protein